MLRKKFSNVAERMTPRSGVCIKVGERGEKVFVNKLLCFSTVRKNVTPLSDFNKLAMGAYLMKDGYECLEPVC